MKILIVDDIKENIYLLEAMLKGAGYDIVSAVNGAEALEKLRAEGFDMIVSDILMPVMDGFKLCQECKGDEKLKDIPFIFYTATYKDERDEELASKLGADKFLIKPMEPQEFVKIIQSVFREAEEGKLYQRKPVAEEEKDVRKLYSERLVRKLENKTLDLETEIAEHKQAEEALRESEESLKTYLESAPDGVYINDLKGTFLYGNKKAEEIMRYKREELIGKSFLKLNLLPAKYLAKAGKLLALNAMGRSTGPDEFELIRSDGSRVWVEINTALTKQAEEKMVVIGFVREITERKRAEEQTKQLREYLQLQVDRMPIALIVWDTEFRVQTWNPAAEKIFGFTAEEALGRHPYDIIVPKEAQPQVDNVWRQLLEGDMTAYSTNENITKDGRAIVCEWTNTPLKKADGTVTGILSMTQDITERKQAEENIKRAAEEWRTTFDSITDLVSICDKDFRLVRVNKAFADVFKKKPAELVGKPCYEIVHGTKEPLPNCPHKKTMKTKKPATAEFFEPHLGMHLEMSTSPIFNEKGEVVASVHLIRDITERKRMEEQLIVTDRLASIGELSSGIAHELNNPLTGVIGFSDLLLDRDLPDDIKEDLEVINREAKRAAGVVRNLLTFARKHAPEKQPVNINSLIEKVLEIRAYEQKVSNLEVDTRFASDLPEITADGFQLQQVFLNIIINAEHFMTEAHGRGTLTITTERVGDIIRASFADDGPGIDKENLGHLFDPFFTTKEVGKGTGLGLSICHGIITEHGGRIYAESKLGKGATFVMELPISK